MEEITLLFRGRVLKDDQTLMSYKVERNNTILLVRRRHPEPGSLYQLAFLLAQPPAQPRETREAENQNVPFSSFSYHLHQLFIPSRFVMHRELLRDDVNAYRDRLGASLQSTSGSHPIPGELVEKIRTITDIFQTIQTSTQSVIAPVLSVLHVWFCILNDM